MKKRNYSLLGDSGKRAVEIGLTSAEWYRPDIPREKMKGLLKRSNGPALRDTILYFGLMGMSAAFAVWMWPSWWSTPFWLIYGVLYASGADSRWHECGHGTAFKTPWMNGVVYQIACFCLLRNPVLWHWSHARHHTDTIIVGRDPEIITMRPPNLFKVLILFLGWDSIRSFGKMLRHAVVGMNEEEKTFVPESERHKVMSTARAWISIFVAVGVVAYAMSSILPVMLVGGPVIYGSWHYIMTGLLQHTGMADNVIDHRLNTRTLYVNPFSRFIYWNMNYHIEHHLFPMVPYHALPRLHQMIRNDLPEPNHSIAEGFREVMDALRKQLKDPEYRIEKTLPDTAQPYRRDLQAESLKC